MEPSDITKHDPKAAESIYQMGQAAKCAFVTSIGVVFFSWQWALVALILSGILMTGAFVRFIILRREAMEAQS